MVEQQTVNLPCVGSNPTSPSKERNHREYACKAET